MKVICADELRRVGWDVRLSGRAGDQGADIIAERQPYRVILQCKCYDAPVGNKAVQEAIAARAFEEGTHAAVVTNSTFTQSAQQLAAKTGVLLLHHHDLKVVYEKLGA